MDTSEHEYTNFAFTFMVSTLSIYDMPYISRGHELVWTWCLLLQGDDTLHLARCMDMVALRDSFEFQ